MIATIAATTDALGWLFLWLLLIGGAIGIAYGLRGPK